MGGLRGSIGLQLVLHERGKEQTPPVLVGEKGWADVGSLMGRSQRVNMVASRPPAIMTSFNQDVVLADTTIKAFRASSKLMAVLKTKFDLAALAAFLQDTGLSFTVDCLHGGAGLLLTNVMKELGRDPCNVLLNAKSLVDSGGGTPSPHPSSEYASLELFGTRPLSANGLLNFPVLDVEQDEGGKEEERASQEDSMYDLGFVLDANAQRCGVLLAGLYVREEESECVLSQLPLNQRDRAHGIYSILGWLTVIMQSSATGSDPKTAALAQLRRVWATKGRNITVSLRMELAEKDGVALMEALRFLPMDGNRDWSSVDVRARNGTSTLALADMEEVSNVTMSARSFARLGQVTLAAAPLMLLPCVYLTLLSARCACH